MKQHFQAFALAFAGAVIMASWSLSMPTSPGQDATELDFAAAVETWTQTEKDLMLSAYSDIQLAKAAAEQAAKSVSSAEGKLVELVLNHKHAPPVVEPPVLEPPVLDIGAWPEALPFNAPPMPAYIVPTIDDCEWIERDGILTSTKGLASVRSVHDAYRASMAAGQEKPITFGVFDNLGRAVVGGLYNSEADHSITQPDEAGGWAKDLEVEFVGLDESCELSIGWSQQWGYAAYVGVFNIGIRGQNDSFILRANDGVGRVIIDGCWWLPFIKPDGTPTMHASGMHLDKWQTLVWRRHQFRGETPDQPGTNLREHSAYLKSCVGDAESGGGSWIIENDLRGGNRTGFQFRPAPIGQYANPRPRGPIVIAYNFADGYGWNHGDGGETYDGGGCITSWIGPESPVYVFRNRISDAKYACLVLSGQAPERNYLNEDGWPIQSAYIFGNEFENKRGDREAVILSAIENLHLYENDIEGSKVADVTLDAPWNMEQNGIAIGTLSIHGELALSQLEALRVRTWDATAPSKVREVTNEELLLHAVE
jgi:hypothetical protein